MSNSALIQDIIVPNEDGTEQEWEFFAALVDEDDEDLILSFATRVPREEFATPASIRGYVVGFHKGLADMIERLDDAGRRREQAELPEQAVSSPS